MQREVSLPDEVIFIPHCENADTPSLDVYNLSHILYQLLFQALMENARIKAGFNDLSDRSKELEAENEGLKAENKELKAEIQKLFEQSNLGCDTSGIPSSKDWKKGNASEEPEKATDSNVLQEETETPISVTDYLNNKGVAKRSPGGQEKHPPASMRVDGTREGDPVQHYPNKCSGCPKLKQCIEEGRFRRYYTGHGYDIEVTLIHREHQVFEATDCLHDGSQIRDGIPQEVIGSRFYDTNVQIHVLTWHQLFYASYDRIDLAAKELLGLSLSAGTANAIVARASAKILSSGFMDAIRFFVLLFEKVAGVDETSALVGGINAWVHTVATANVTLLSAHWRRGFDGTIYAGVVQFFTYTLISDCWAAYFNATFKFKHAICDAHILRELVAAAYFRQQSWAIEMFDLLLEVFAAKRDAVERGEKHLPQIYIDDIKERYRLIVANGYNENAGATKGKTFALLERLKKLEDAALAFAVDFRVDFTNNASEISLRNLKVALRVAGQFKTMSGLVNYCIIQSFMDTCRKQGRNPFDMMKVLLCGGDIIEAVFGVEKAIMIKQMIELTKAIAKADSDEINNIKAEMGSMLTDDLIAAASYGQFEAYKDPPPEKKNSSPTVPKDKMKAAREKDTLKKSSLSTDVQPSDRVRAGPICA